MVQKRSKRPTSTAYGVWWWWWWVGWRRGGDGGRGGGGDPDQVPPEIPDRQTPPNLNPNVNPNKKRVPVPVQAGGGEGVGGGITVWGALCCCQSRIRDGAYAWPTMRPVGHACCPEMSRFNGFGASVWSGIYTSSVVTELWRSGCAFLMSSWFMSKL